MDGQLQLPLSSRLSQALVAFTIEFDNELEHRMPHRTARGQAAHSGVGPWLISMAMWSNFLQFLDADPVPLREVDGLARTTNLGGLKRWGYVSVTPDPADVRARPPNADWLVRLKPGGVRAGRLMRPLAAEIEGRWRDRFGAQAVDELRRSLAAIVHQMGGELPRHLPVVNYANGMRTSPEGVEGWVAAFGRRGTTADRDICGLLAHVLLSYTLEFERGSRLSLPMRADVLRVLNADGARVRDVPLLAGVSKEAISAALGFLVRYELAVIEPDPGASRTKLVRLTPRGQSAKGNYSRLLAQVDGRWRARFGAERLDRLQAAVKALFDQRGERGQSRIALGLQPYEDGWRAQAPYLAQTRAVLRDPEAALPHHPMVLHRGGYPDGS